MILDQPQDVLVVHDDDVGVLGEGTLALLGIAKRAIHDEVAGVLPVRRLGVPHGAGDAQRRQHQHLGDLALGEQLGDRGQGADCFARAHVGDDERLVVLVEPVDHLGLVLV